MDNLQVFNFNENQVRTVTINNDIYFVGKDVAEILGYAKPRNAISTHVSEEDKKEAPIQGDLGGIQQMTIINESGLYSLILSSKLPQAKEFKRWVTSEVLPTIRKQGSYQVPTNPMQALELMFQAQKETNSIVADHAKRITELEENKLLSEGEYRYIGRAVSHRVNSIMKDLNTKNIIVRSKLYASINRDLNAYVGVKTRTQLRAKDFNVACEFLENYQPSYTDLKIIEQVKLEI